MFIAKVGYCLLVLFGMLGLSSCYILVPDATYPLPHESSGIIKFSPDSRTIAFIWSRYWTDMSMNQNVVKEEKYFNWCSVDNIRKQHSMKIDSLNHVGFATVNRHTFLFSPDSENVLFIAGQRLCCLNLNSEELILLSNPDEQVQTYGWKNSTCVEYGRLLNNSFWEVNIHQPSDRKPIEGMTCTVVDNLLLVASDSYLPPYWYQPNQQKVSQPVLQSRLGEGSYSFFKLRFPHWIGVQVHNLRDTANYAVKLFDQDNVIQTVLLFRDASGLWDVSPDGRYVVTFEGFSPRNLLLNEIELSQYGIE